MHFPYFTGFLCDNIFIIYYIDLILNIDIYFSFNVLVIHHIKNWQKELLIVFRVNFSSYNVFCGAV